jgi:uncharacterized protein
VFAPDDPGRPCRVLSLGEPKWDKVMTPGHLELDNTARNDVGVQLIGLDALYG